MDSLDGITTIALCGPGRRGRALDNVTFNMEKGELNGRLRHMNKNNITCFTCREPVRVDIHLLKEFPNLNTINLYLSGGDHVRHFDLNELPNLIHASILAQGHTTVNLRDGIQSFHCGSNVVVQGGIPAHLQEEKDDEDAESVDSDATDIVPESIMAAVPAVPSAVPSSINFAVFFKEK